MRLHQAGRRWALLGSVTAVSLGAVLACAAPAVADSASLSIGISPDPTVGEPITFTIQGATPAPGDSDYSAYGYVVTLVFRPVGIPCAAGSGPWPGGGDDVKSASDDDSGFGAVASWGNSPEQPLSGSFAMAYTYTPYTHAIPPGGDTSSVYEPTPGSYIECVWLESSQHDVTDPAILLRQQSFTIAKPHDSVTIHGPRRVRLSHYSGTLRATEAHAHWLNFTVSVRADVTRGRTVELVSEPRGVRRCPADVWSIWDRPRYSGSPDPV
ncbi:MAG: hypothetical protein ACRDNS_11480, partial [Trebonia sp.]